VLSFCPKSLPISLAAQHSTRQALAHGLYPTHPRKHLPRCQCPGSQNKNKNKIKSLQVQPRVRATRSVYPQPGNIALCDWPSVPISDESSYLAGKLQKPRYTIESRAATGIPDPGPGASPASINRSHGELAEWSRARLPVCLSVCPSVCSSLSLNLTVAAIP
jgi:hypothetical protein